MDSPILVVFRYAAAKKGGSGMSPEMQYVYTVYQEGSFSKAAEKLYLTQPALSTAIHKVEQSIGMPLFDRKRKPIRLTDAGEIYVDTIRKMMLLEQEQQQRLNDIQNLVTGSIRLGGTHYLIAYILPQILASFSRQYPGVTLEIQERSSYELAGMLANRELDVTFNCDPEFVQMFPRQEMFEDHVLLAVPATAPFNSLYPECALTAAQVLAERHTSPDCPRLRLTAFADLEFILLRKGNNLHERAWQMFREADIQPKIKMDLNQLVTAFHLAEAGMGATFVSDRIVRPQNTALRYYPLDSALASRMFYILLPKDAYVPVAVRRFVEHIRSWDRM